MATLISFRTNYDEHVVLSQHKRMRFDIFFTFAIYLSLWLNVTLISGVRGNTKTLFTAPLVSLADAAAAFSVVASSRNVTVSAGDSFKCSRITHLEVLRGDDYRETSLLWPAAVARRANRIHFSAQSMVTEVLVFCIKRAKTLNNSE